MATTLRVVSSDSTGTALLVGGYTYATTVAYSAVLIYGSVAAGSANFSMTGSVLLPSSSGEAVTALSQTGALHQGFVLANTDMGVFKCVLHMPIRVEQASWCSALTALLVCLLAVTADFPLLCN